MPTNFLCLPAELRNRIYEMALVPENQEVRVGYGNCEVPPLLRWVTNSKKAPLESYLADFLERSSLQVSREARGYYYCNKFIVEVFDYQPEVAIRFFKHFALHGDPSPGEFEFDFGHQPEGWNNFVRLLSAVYVGDLPHVHTPRINGIAQPMSKEHAFARTGTRMADAMRYHKFTAVLTAVDAIRWDNGIEW